MKRFDISFYRFFLNTCYVKTLNSGNLDLVRLGKKFEQLELSIQSQETSDVKRKTFHKQGVIQKTPHSQNGIFYPSTSHFLTFLFNQICTCQSLKSYKTFW